MLNVYYSSYDIGYAVRILLLRCYILLYNGYIARSYVHVSIRLYAYEVLIKY
jgi:hypothetical protein